jgi:hypothetical protein
LYFRIDPNFYKRRSGLKHAYNILKVRFEVNNRLNFGLNAYNYAIVYAFLKLLPSGILKFAYKKLR